ncbi:MAG: rhodanese-like domain-containing protein [Firmicutes bacterium]|nr:rhodanese-like domain-containing protein [Bacillota bacterium]
MINKDNLAHITGPELEDLIHDNFIKVIDIREKYEIDITFVPGTINIPFNTLLRTFPQTLDKNTVYYILCHTGQRSYYVTKILTENGYMAVNVLGGIRAMKKYYVHY